MMEYILPENIDPIAREMIAEMTDRLVKVLNPERVYLFGSFADGSYSEGSDYDFYIVVNNGTD